MKRPSSMVEKDVDASSSTYTHTRCCFVSFEIHAFGRGPVHAALVVSALTRVGLGRYPTTWRLDYSS